MTNTDLEAKIQLRLTPETVAHMRLYRIGIIGNSSLELVELRPEASYPPHYHAASEAHFYMVAGEGTILIGEEETPYKPGDTFHIGKGVEHGFRPSGTTFFLSVQTPPIKDPKTGVEDIHFA